MGNIIKLKQKDIENIVKNIVKEAAEYDDFDTKIQPEEFPEDDFDMNDPEFQYQDPTTGSTLINPFGNKSDFSSILNSFGVALQSPRRLINLNKQLNLVFRVITREMDSLPQIRPDNN
jgi:hypothetical protein